MLLGGLQLMAMGIIGEYLGRLCMESKRRPLYLLDEYQPALLGAPVVTANLTASLTASANPT